MPGKVLLFGSGLVRGALGAVWVCRPDLLETHRDAQDLPDGNAGKDGQGLPAAPDVNAATPLSDVDKGEMEGLLSAFPSAPKAESCLLHAHRGVFPSGFFHEYENDTIKKRIQGETR